MDWPPHTSWRLPLGLIGLSLASLLVCSSPVRAGCSYGHRAPNPLDRLVRQLALAPPGPAAGPAGQPDPADPGSGVCIQCHHPAPAAAPGFDWLPEWGLSPAAVAMPVAMSRSAGPDDGPIPPHGFATPIERPPRA